MLVVDRKVDITQKLAKIMQMQHIIYASKHSHLFFLLQKISYLFSNVFPDFQMTHDVTKHFFHVGFGRDNPDVECDVIVV